MVLYRRDFTAGGTYFFTLTLQNRRSQLLTQNIQLLKQAFKHCQQKKPFVIDAIVILPDHLHAIFTLPENDTNYSHRWRLIKASFTRQLLKNGLNLSCNQRGEYSLWQKRFWEHRIRHSKDLKNHVDYIHFNPVKHGLVKHAHQWQYSSIHRYIREGLLPDDWGGIDLNGRFGE